MTSMIPSDYLATLDRIKSLVHESRYVAQRRVNTELLKLYWQIGDTLNDRQRNAAWGANVVGKLADDLRAEFPSMKGFSRANLFYMRRVAEAWPDPDQFVQQAAGQIPWTHLTLILDKVAEPELRGWYATRSAAHGWSRGVLSHQIATRLHEREGIAPSNYPAALERADSDLAQEITKDPYALGFLAVDSTTSEVELESRLVDRIVETLRELGPGFAFVGRQVHFEVDGDDFFIDLLFFHVEQLRYVVIELKTKKFDPRDAGQLGFYVALVEDRLRRPPHQPTVGMLLVADKNDSVVRYSLAGSTQPIAVSRYELSASAQAALPAEDVITRAVTSELAIGEERD
ncbi:MAG: DUF1016 family protein [Actinobacteria bacterium]|nr:DUF1016 family protein [Actinomycetota bacterium]